MMIGGYYSFQGINGGARYHRTPIEEVLPVTCHPFDDRIEVPDGFKADVVGTKHHPILDGLGKDWPILLGVNEVQVKSGDGVELLARLPAEEGGHPLLVTGHHGKGRTIAWTSDIGPHWVPAEFAAWQGFGRLWRQCLGWLTDR